MAMPYAEFARAYKCPYDRALHNSCALSKLLKKTSYTSNFFPLSTHEKDGTYTVLQVFFIHKSEIIDLENI